MVNVPSEVNVHVRFAPQVPDAVTVDASAANTVSPGADRQSAAARTMAKSLIPNDFMFSVPFSLLKVMRGCCKKSARGRDFPP